MHYIYDLDGHLIAEADGATGATLREYIWLASNDNAPVDLPLALVTAVNTATPVLSMVHADHLGRPIRMTDAARATVWQAFYNPWGEPYSLAGSIENNLRFPGQVFLIETGLAYNWHRHYDASTGRYTQADPLRFVDGPSVYAYVGGSPYMNVDPTGQAIPIAIAACLASPPCAAGLAALSATTIGVIAHMLNDECNCTASSASDETDAGGDEIGDTIAKAGVPAYPGLGNLGTDCVPGKRLVSPITKGRHKGQINVEQEYLCAVCGLVTRHTIISANGKIVHDHFRPGPAKGTDGD